jgi:hypothetical protein
VRVRGVNRLEDVLADVTLKLGTVATAAMGISARALLAALLDG